MSMGKMSKGNSSSCDCALDRDAVGVDGGMDTTADWDERLRLGVGSSTEVSESFRVLRSKILHPRDGRERVRTVMVTSALPREGKSFVSANLGISLAHGVDQYSLLVDCDLRVPALAGLFGLPCGPGLVDYLEDRAQIADLIRKTSVDKLSILASGRPPVNPAELLGSMRMHALIEELSERYEDRVLIFDSPPLQVASESLVLSQMVDYVILVVRHGVSGSGIIKKVITDIGREKMLGVIFNGHKKNALSSMLLYKNDYLYDT